MSLIRQTAQQSFANSIHKNSDTNLAINPYLAKLDRAVLIIRPQARKTLQYKFEIRFSLTQRNTNTIPLQVGRNRLSVALVGYNRLPTSRFLTLSDLFIWRTASCRLFRTLWSGIPITTPMSSSEEIFRSYFLQTFLSNRPLYLCRISVSDSSLSKNLLCIHNRPPSLLLDVSSLYCYSLFGKFQLVEKPIDYSTT